MLGQKCRTLRLCIQVLEGLRDGIKDEVEALTRQLQVRVLSGLHRRAHNPASPRIDGGLPSVGNPVRESGGNCFAVITSHKRSWRAASRHRDQCMHAASSTAISLQGHQIDEGCTS